MRDVIEDITNAVGNMPSEDRKVYYQYGDKDKVIITHIVSYDGPLSGHWVSDRNGLFVEQNTDMAFQAKQLELLRLYGKPIRKFSVLSYSWNDKIDLKLTLPFPEWEVAN